MYAGDASERIYVGWRSDRRFDRVLDPTEPPRPRARSIYAIASHVGDHEHHCAVDRDARRRVGGPDLGAHTHCPGRGRPAVNDLRSVVVQPVAVQRAREPRVRELHVEPAARFAKLIAVERIRGRDDEILRLDLARSFVHALGRNAAQHQADDHHVVHVNGHNEPRVERAFMNPNITAAMLMNRRPNEALERNGGCHAFLAPDVKARPWQGWIVLAISRLSAS